MGAEISLNIDLDHPAIGAYTVFSKQAGYLLHDDVVEAFQKAGLPKSLVPQPPGHSVFLKRAMQDVAKGIGDSDTAYRVESKGKFSGAIYSIIRVARDRLDLSSEESNDGLGVADALVSAKLVGDGDTGVNIVVTPQNSPFTQRIHDLYNYHSQHFKCAEDLSVFLSQKLFRSNHVGAVPRAGAGGTFFVPKGPGCNLLFKVREVFNEISEFGRKRELENGVKIYFTPMITTFDDVVDAITDSVLDEAEKFCDLMENSLFENNTGTKDLGVRALTTKTKEAKAFHTKMESFKAVTGSALNDVTDRLKALEVRIGMATLAAATDD